MAIIGTVNAGSKIIDIHAFSGEVVDQEKSSYTEVTRSNNNNNQSVTTTNYTKIFVRAADGEERSLQIFDSGFGVRAGSKASFLWGIPKGKDKGDYVAVVNHDTGSVHTIRKAVNDLAGPPFYNMLLIVASIFIALGFFDLFSGKLGSALVMAGIGVGGIYWIYIGQKKLIAQIKDVAVRLKPSA